ncbi:MAG: FixH family protein [Armatimonadota bacterium]|nr:FixH family protein [Armatimonadota bacterium]MDR7438691.1 FixH family protein [Armatimonadota bacterium]MDR7563733.1 FixH family protein [Armatimonadota bacterium]MDR7567311.1 FixH family protein [Armatimonadota bacterium]MDR7602551.1 FixH family protein [Armatimonadota bacterium]
MRWALPLLVLLLGACAPNPTAQVSGEGWKVSLEWFPARPQALRPVTLRLRIQDGTGHPLAITNLQVRASMPEMTHEPEEIPFRQAGPGHYEAQHAFSMDGRWEIRVSGQAEGVRILATFTLDAGP